MPASNVNVTNSPSAAFSQTEDSWYIDTGTPVTQLTYTSFAIKFTLTMLPDYQEFTQLFDQYKICGVRLKITPYSTSAELQPGFAGASNQNLASIVHSVVDYDDATQFSADSPGIQEMRQYPSYRTTNLLRGGRPITRYFRPHIAQAAYGAGVFTSYANVGPRWIDAVSTGVEHYGTKFVIETFRPDATQRCYIWMKMEATLYLKVKNPR